jgi:hypothetical protein
MGSIKHASPFTCERCHNQLGMQNQLQIPAYFWNWGFEAWNKIFTRSKGATTVFAWWTDGLISSNSCDIGLEYWQLNQLFLRQAIPWIYSLLFACLDHRLYEISSRLYPALFSVMAQSPRLNIPTVDHCVPITIFRSFVMYPNSKSPLTCTNASPNAIRRHWAGTIYFTLRRGLASRGNTNEQIK